MAYWLAFTGLLLASLLNVARGAGDKTPPVSYSRDVRPILTARCFACHGPDKQARKAELRLDVRTAAVADRNGTRAIVAGKPHKSEVFRRISSRDADVRMPPKDSGKTLTTKQIELIRRWIEQGANYDRHWAFVKPELPRLPPVRNRAWVRNDVDRFVLARLERAGLQPSPQADAETLARRVSLDLIGLQPTVEEIDAFAKDVRESSFDAAYERLVNRLLASPRYGERWARRWLDLARYADTNGYEKDRPRSIWPYRDWVIAALNRDMPFDRFSIEQIAGDMLPSPKGDATNPSRKLATGFHRNTMLNEEGGIDPLEYRFYAMVDRVATTGTTWLGLTLGCAQCHSHKYDPVSHADFYRVMAFLNNADEPELELPDRTLAAQFQANERRARQLLAELPEKWPLPKDEKASRRQLAERRFSEWLAVERRRTVNWTRLRPVSAKSNLPLLTVQADNSVFASGDTTKSDLFTLQFKPQAEGIAAVLLEALPDERLPERGPGSTYYEGTRGDFFLGEFRLFADGKPVKIAGASHSYAKNRFGPNPVSAQLAVDGDPQTGWSVHGRQGERHTAVFVLKQPLRKTGLLKLEMMFGRHFASSLGRFRISVTTAKGAVARDLPLEVERLLAERDSRLTDSQRRVLFEEFLLRAPELAKPAEQIRRLRKRPDFPTTLVMQERPPENPRPTFVHKRGEFLQPTVKVTPGVPAFLPPLPKNAPRNRLGFARWLVSSENPLTARVVVNRQWAAFFGRGIVRTLDDFGVQGDSPTHPQLLDRLAVTFQRPRWSGGMGWSLKALHRQIVMSATYRQSSRANAEARRIDPENQLLSYAPRPRLEAEIIRDSVLRAAGLLSTKMGGPGVRPPQPRGVTEVAYGSPKWIASRGEDRHRRSIYTFLKRTAPFAMYRIFDASSGESCTARRDRSNTPLQALTMLNDVMFVEAARSMGRLIAARSGDDAARMRYGFRRLLTRRPSDEETALLVRFVRAQRGRFRSGELNAVTASGAKQNAVEVAAWTSLSRALFGLDEAVTRN
jgi:mono/diheme cytochrome c family protein